MAKNGSKRVKKTKKEPIVIPRATKKGCELKVRFVIPTGKKGCD